MIPIDLDIIWYFVAVVATTLAGFWSFRRLKTLFTGR